MKHVRYVSHPGLPLAQYQSMYEIIGVVQGVLGTFGIVMSLKSQYMYLIDQSNVFQKNPVNNGGGES